MFILRSIKINARTNNDTPENKHKHNKIQRVQSNICVQSIKSTLYNYNCLHS